MAGRREGIDIARGARTSLRSNAAAYAYSIFITSCFAITNDVVGNVSVARIFLFLGGATVAFAATETVVSHGFRDRIRPEPGDVVMLGSAMAVISVSVAVAVSWAAGEVFSGSLAWFLASFVGTLVYIFVSAIEMAVARKRHDEDPPDREK